MEMKYEITVRYNGERKYIQVNDYCLAWTVYRFMVDIYPEGATVDIIDLFTGEVFQSNSPDF